MAKRDNNAVLVVEDDSIVALDLALHLSEGGYNLLGPFADSRTALKGLEDTTPAFAIIDYRLRDGTSEAVARRLETDGVPYVFMTVVSRSTIPKTLSPVAFLEKPYIVDNLEAFMG